MSFTENGCDVPEDAAADAGWAAAAAAVPGEAEERSAAPSRARADDLGGIPRVGRAASTDGIRPPSA